MQLNNKNIGVAITGSYCTFEKTIEVLKKLKEEGANLIPIMSYNAYSLDTKFGKAKEYIERIEKICEKAILKTITDVEPIGPRKMLDVLLIMPCTGNTISKISNSISDTPVTCAVKSQLRNERSVLLAISTNDGLGGNAKNVGLLLNIKNIYMVPFFQDNPIEKPRSLMFRKDMVISAIETALEGKQLQPIICEKVKVD